MTQTISDSHKIKTFFLFKRLKCSSSSGSSSQLQKCILFSKRNKDDSVYVLMSMLYRSIQYLCVCFSLSLLLFWLSCTRFCVHKHTDNGRVFIQLQNAIYCLFLLFFFNLFYSSFDIRYCIYLFHRLLLFFSSLYLRYIYLFSAIHSEIENIYLLSLCELRRCFLLILFIKLREIVCVESIYQYTRRNMHGLAKRRCICKSAISKCIIESYFCTTLYSFGFFAVYLLVKHSRMHTLTHSRTHTELFKKSTQKRRNVYRRRRRGDEKKSFCLITHQCTSARQCGVSTLCVCS